MLSRKRINQQKANHAKEIAHIREKLEKIRLRVSRLEGGSSRQDWTHYEGVLQQCVSIPTLWLAVTFANMFVLV